MRMLSRESLYRLLLVSSVCVFGLAGAGCPGTDMGTGDDGMNGGDDGNGGGAGQPIPDGDFVLEIAIDGQGTVDQSANANVVQLTAVPADGWEFIEWTGTTNATDNPITVIANDDTSIGVIFLQVDGDNDGTPDVDDVCAGGDDSRDQDEDGIPDDCDDCVFDANNDADDDGICGDEDNCPSVANADQDDADGDGVGDACDECPNDEDNDIDNDGVCGDVDNCPEDANAGQIDSDNDGAGDECDECPNDANDDADNDGVCEPADLCDNTPSNENANADGCSPSQLDTDGDGVSDADDDCSGTASGATVDANGCSPAQLDTDGDGVTNDLDQCPGTPSGDNPDAEGCGDSQRDTDDDGVIDADDLCPGTPIAEAGDVDSDGCSPSQLDADGDGVNDADDLCPGTLAALNVDVDGCPTCAENLDEGNGECDDGDACTDDFCVVDGELGRNVCSNVAIACDDELFCNGLETCDPATGCLAGDPPCDGEDEVCNEVIDDCEPACASNDDCTDGLFCNGDETCNLSTGVCELGTAPCDTETEFCDETVDDCFCFDDDEDGVCNDVDDCPNTPLEDTPNEVGCGETERDTDEDGFLDADDSCPTVPGVAPDGCPPVLPATFVSNGSTILFAADPRVRPSLTTPETYEFGAATSTEGSLLEVTIDVDENWVETMLVLGSPTGGTLTVLNEMLSPGLSQVTFEIEDLLDQPGLTFQQTIEIRTFALEFDGSDVRLTFDYDVTMRDDGAFPIIDLFNAFVGVATGTLSEDRGSITFTGFEAGSTRELCDTGACVTENLADVAIDPVTWTRTE